MLINRRTASDKKKRAAIFLAAPFFIKKSIFLKLQNQPFFSILNYCVMLNSTPDIEYLPPTGHGELGGVV